APGRRDVPGPGRGPIAVTRRVPRPPPVRALALDIDGTLTDADRRLHLPVIDRLRRIERRGVPVILVTGNVLPLAIAVHRFLGLGRAIIAENGGLVYEDRDGIESVTRLAHRAVALRAFSALRRAGLAPQRLFTDRWRETEVALRPGISVERARRVLAGYPVEVIPTGYAVHLMERGAGKLPALRRVLRPLGLSPGDCLVAGDGENDVPMLRAAGWAVSFRGADPLALQAADFVGRAAHGAGLVEALKRAQVVDPTGR
ncbi:MAG: phosphoglycolate phosphatase, partial [Thermoplasmata archaeon]